MNMGGHKMSRRAAKILGNILRSTGSFQGIYLPNTRFEKDSFQDFLEGFLSNPDKRLRFILDLSDCNLKERGAKIFFDTIGKRKVSS